MKIQNNQNKYLQTVNQINNNRVQKKKAKKVETSAEQNVKIDISEKAKALSKAAANKAEKQRIEDIKAAIQNDTYEVSPEKIADGILREINAQQK